MNDSINSLILLNSTLPSTLCKHLVDLWFPILRKWNSVVENRPNEQTKKKLESQNPINDNRASVTWEQSYQSHFGTVVPVSLGKIVEVALGDNHVNVTWEQLSWEVKFLEISSFQQLLKQIFKNLFSEKIVSDYSF